MEWCNRPLFPHMERGKRLLFPHIEWWNLLLFLHLEWCNMILFLRLEWFFSRTSNVGICSSSHTWNGAKGFFPAYRLTQRASFLPYGTVWWASFTKHKLVTTFLGWKNHLNFVLWWIIPPGYSQIALSHLVLTPLIHLSRLFRSFKVSSHSSFSNMKWI